MFTRIAHPLDVKNTGFPVGDALGMKKGDPHKSQSVPGNRRKREPVRRDTGRQISPARCVLARL
jgi:hypothetical protein